MLFSIITPVYNAKKTIRRCIMSVTAQSERDFEYIIVDDGSTDGSTDGIEELLTGIRSKVIRVPNGGVSAARNTGLDCSSGEYILFLDADDELTSDALAQYKAAINRPEPPDILFSGFYKVYPKKTAAFALSDNQKVLVNNEKTNEFDPYISRLIGTVWGKCYKKSLIGNERFSESLKLCEDAEFNFRIFEKAKEFLYVNEYTYKYYYFLTSTIRKYNPSYIQMYVEAIERIRESAQTAHRIGRANEFACTVFNVICFNVIFTKQNNQSKSEKMAAVKDVCEQTVFRNVLAEADTDCLSVRHKVPIRAAKKRHYRLLPLLAKMNALLNRLLY